MRYLQEPFEKGQAGMSFCESMFAFPFPLDTIPGRQCMASCFFLLRQFEDVLIYLNSIKVNAPNKASSICSIGTGGPRLITGTFLLLQSYFYNDDAFNFNYAQAKAALGSYQEAEEVVASSRRPLYCAREIQRADQVL